MGLPRHWASLRLRDLTLSVEKVDPIQLGRESFRYVDIGSVDGSRHVLAGVRDVPTAHAPSRARQLLREGDTVFSTVRPYLEKIAYVDGSLNGEIASTGFSVLRPGPRLVPKYLFYFAASQEMLSQVLPYQKGVSYPAVLDREVREVAVPLPPLEEQHQITGILEEYFSRLDTAHDSLLRARTLLSRFRDTCDNRLVWGSSAPTMPIGALLREPMRNGHSARAVHDGGSGVRTLTLTAVTSGCFEEQNTKMTAPDPSKVQDLWLQSGDIFVERANTPELVGTSALYEGPNGWAVFPDLLIRLRVDEQLARPRYLALALATERAHRWLRRRAKGLAGSMPKIDQRTVAECEVPVPSLVQQDEILTAAGIAHEASARMAQEVQKALDQSMGLRRSILTAAFSGRLAVTTPDFYRSLEHIETQPEAEAG